MKIKFWLENINCLFYEYELNPIKKMSIESKMNTITRIVILSFIILLFSEIFNMKNNIIFLILSLFLIIILYYKQKNTIQMIENFEISDDPKVIIGGANRNTFTSPKFEHSFNEKDMPIRSCKNTARINYRCSKRDDENIIKTIEQPKYYIDETDYNARGYNPNFARPTDNQFLVGGPNPKTFIPPIISTPAMDIDYWRKKDTYTNSTINVKKERYNNESGYNTTTQNIPVDYSYPQNNDCKVKYKKNHKYDNKSKKYGKVGVMEEKLNTQIKQAQQNKEAFDFPYDIKSKKNNNLNNPDSLYYKDFKSNPYFMNGNKYNENAFKEIISPGNYNLNTRNEPIDSNIGISEPQTFQDDDSYIIEPFEDVNMSNVYDPRFHGYGTSYRGYVDKTVGQPRFYYDDIDAIKMPNYITRNHIDTTPFGDSYGPMDTNGNQFTSNIHQLADRHYGDSMMQFRNEMQERLMRKVNAEQWQQKLYPINKHSQR